MKLKELERFRNSGVNNNHYSQDVLVNLPNIVNGMSDKQGLNKAYSADSRVFKNNNTLFIAGTSTLQDVFDDLRIPFKDTANAWRYEVASNILDRDSTINTLVGHSLAGSVALELQKNKPERQFRVITYGAPVLDFHSDRKDPTIERYRNLGDPISILDRGAKNSIHGPNPHSFQNFDMTHNLDKSIIPGEII